MNKLNRCLCTFLLGCAVAAAGAAQGQTSTKALTSYQGCIKDPLPVPPGIPSFPLVDSSRIGFADVRVWRSICLDNPNRSMILIRIAPYPIGDSLVNGENITAIQNGVTIGPFNLLQTTGDVSGYVGYLDQATTFILAQTSALPTLLNENGAFKLVFRAGGLPLATLDIPALGFDEVIASTLVEFYHSVINHYLMTLNPAQIAALDQPGTGWVRTGQAFPVFTLTSAPEMFPVCRFVGNSSLFYTVDHAECIQTNKDPNWKFDGVAFFAVPDSLQTSCADRAMRPLFRLFNQRPDANHRYVVNPALIAETMAKGFVNEGQVMCVPAP